MKILILSKQNFEAAHRICEYLQSCGHSCGIDTRKVSEMSFSSDFYDLGISVHYQHILTKGEIGFFKYGVLNIHPGYLPYGRGADPIIWGMLENDPLGVSIHWVDDGIDTGNILYRTPIHKIGDETATEIYWRTINMYPHMFGMFWSWFHKSIEEGFVPEGTIQTSNRKPKKRKDLEIVGRIEGDFKRYVLALANNNYDNMYIEDDKGRKRTVSIQIGDFYDTN